MGLEPAISAMVCFDKAVSKIAKNVGVDLRAKSERGEARPHPFREMYQELISLTPQRDGSSNRRSRTRRDILRATLELVEMGKPLTVQSIANQSGVSKPTIYRYYNSPEEIERDAFMSEIAADRAVSIFNSVSQTVSEETDVRRRVHLLARTMPQMINANSAFLRSLMVQHYRRPDERPEWFSSLVQQMINNVLEPVRPQLTVQDYRHLCTLLAAHLMADGYLIIEDRAKSFGVTAGETTRIAVDLLLDRYLGTTSMLGTSPRYPAAG